MYKLFKNPLTKFSTKKIHSTTVLAVKKNNEVFMIADGQVSQGDVIIKTNANKIREIKPNVVAGFAGSLADALTILDELEKYIDKYQNFSLLKPCIELAIKWRTEGAYKRLEASVLVSDHENLIELDGQGNVLVHDKYRAIGSGGPFAECATEALYDFEDYDSEKIAKRAMEIAASKCVFSNNNFNMKKITAPTKTNVN